MNATLFNVVLFCLMLLGCDQGVVTTAYDTGYKVGDTATDFKLKNVAGKMASMVDYKNAKGSIVSFTCNTWASATSSISEYLPRRLWPFSLIPTFPCRNCLVRML